MFRYSKVLFAFDFIFVLVINLFFFSFILSLIHFLQGLIDSEIFWKIQALTLSEEFQDWNKKVKSIRFCHKFKPAQSPYKLVR